MILLNVFHKIINVIMRKPKRQSRMDNPEKLATLGTHKTQDEVKTNKTQHSTTQNTKNMNNMDPTKNRG
jgi:hypothetical protein